MKNNHRIGDYDTTLVLLEDQGRRLEVAIAKQEINEKDLETPIDDQIFYYGLSREDLIEMRDSGTEFHDGYKIIEVL